eukprot:scaffold602620_cov34-Prasinocladus_malaysianus.AAC.1
MNFARQFFLQLFGLLLALKLTYTWTYLRDFLMGLAGPCVLMPVTTITAQDWRLSIVLSSP